MEDTSRDGVAVKRDRSQTENSLWLVMQDAQNGRTDLGGKRKTGAWDAPYGGSCFLVRVLRISAAPLFKMVFYFFQHLPPFGPVDASVPVANFTPVESSTMVVHFNASFNACVPRGVGVAVRV